MHPISISKVKLFRTWVLTGYVKLDHDSGRVKTSNKRGCVPKLFSYRRDSPFVHKLLLPHAWILNAKVTQLKTKVIRTEELELQVQQQQSLWNDMRINSQSTTGIAPAFRQTTVLAMPRSCEDLRIRGHLASGIYMVIGNKSVVTVYCDFLKPKNDSSKNSFPL